MNRRTLDLAVGGLVLTVVVLGLSWTWQAWQTTTTSMDGMMGGMMTTSTMTTSPSPIWPILLTLVFAGVLGIGYLAIREDVGGSGQQQVAPPPERPGRARDSGRPANDGRSSQPERSVPDQPTDGSSQRPAPSDDESPAEPDETPDVTEEETEGGESDTSGPTAAQRSLLDVLPEDERRILEPVIDSPGVTQIELRDRSDFSKSKVSQTVSDLEQRGLLYRERQGRTYRVYPADDLGE